MSPNKPTGEPSTTTGAISTRVFPQCVPTLVVSGLVLRAHTEADIPFIVEQCQDELSQRFIPLPNPYDIADARSYLTEFVVKGWETGRRREFAVELSGTEPRLGSSDVTRFAGNVSLEAHGSGRFELGFLCHPDARGKGVMTRAATRLITYAFDELDAQVILWRAYEGNLGSRRVAEKLGFTITTALRGWAVNRGVLVDEWQGTLVRSDPRPLV